MRGAADDESQPGDRDDPCDDRELRLRGELDDWAERGVLLFRLVADCGLLERELDPPGDKVLERSRDPDVDLERDRDGTEAEDAGECDLERLLLLLGGVLESDLDLDRLGDRLAQQQKAISIITITRRKPLPLLVEGIEMKSIDSKRKQNPSP